MAATEPARPAVAGADLLLQQARWQLSLAGTEDLQPATDRPRGTGGPPGFAVTRAALGAELTGALDRFTAGAGVPVPAVLAAAFAVLLSRRAGRAPDFPVALAAADGTAHPVNAALATRPTLTALARRLDRATRQAADQARGAVEPLTDTLAGLRRAVDQPPCRAAFRTVPAPPDTPTALADEDQPAGANPSAGTWWPAHLSDVELAGSVRLGSDPVLELHHRSDLYLPTTAGRIVEEYRTLCRSLLAAPDRPVELADQHGPRLAELRSHTAGPPPPVSGLPVHQVVARWIAGRPDAIAVRYGSPEPGGSDVGGAEPGGSGSSGSMTYGELGARAGALAGRLGAAGVRAGDAVAVLVGRAAELPVAMLGVLRTGAAYLSVDGALPDRRIAAMFAVTRPAAVVVDGPRRAAAERLGLPVVPVPGPGAGTAADGDRHEAAGHPDDLAYLMFTSGTTGEPKCVGVTHRGLATLAERPGWVAVGETDVVAGLAPAYFGGAMLEIWLALLNGAALALAPTTRMSPAELGAFLTGHRVTVAHLTPGLLRVVADERPAALSGLRHLLTGGDVVRPGPVARIAAALPGLRTTACYGCTEIAVLASVADLDRVEPGRPVPIGRPLPGRELYVLDPAGRPASPGVTGEIAVGGDGLARGYVGRPGLTADRFVPHPYRPGARLYRTGDTGRVSADGTVEFLGRSDQQVKIRGFRVEPSEVEIALAEHPAVRQCVVRPRVTPDGPVLVGYLVVSRPTGEDELRAFLRDRLPEYSVPGRYLPLDALPLTPRAKVDGAALDALPLDGGPGGAAVPDLTAAERLVRDAWRAVLGRPHVDPDANFFDLGGHSLSALRAAGRLERALGRPVPVSAIFVAPTVRALARLLDGAPATTGTPGEPATGGTPGEPDRAALAEATGASPEQIAALLDTLPGS
jgi:amino acid adenylation domain-containing protein